MQLPIQNIIVDPRQRIDLGDISALADSIKTHGLLQPLLVAHEPDGYHLVDGFRRLSALKQIGVEATEVYVRENLTKIQKQEMELEADIKRKDRSWQERCLAYLKLFRLKKNANPKWTRGLMVECLGKSWGHVSESLNLAEVLEQTKDKDDPCSKGLWACGGPTEAVQYLLGKNVEAASKELERRRQIMLADPEKAKAFLEEDATKPTSSFNEEVGEKVVTETTVELHNKSGAIDSFTFDSVLLFLTGQNLVLEDIINAMKPEGAAILWCCGFGTYDNLVQECVEKKIDFLLYPLIWNRGTGPASKFNPFCQSYQLGLFISGPSYKKPLDLFIPAVVNAPMAMSDKEPPVSIVQWSLDAISKEGDKVWVECPVRPVVQTALCGRVPVFRDEEKKDEEKLKAHYRSIYGEGVKFV